MRQTVRLGRLAGVPIGVHWSVLVISLLLAQGLALTVLPKSAGGYGGAAYWGVAVGVVAWFLVALLAHELAHALAARHYGVRVKAGSRSGCSAVCLNWTASRRMPGPSCWSRSPVRSPAWPPERCSAVPRPAPQPSAWAPWGWPALAWLAVVNAALAVFNLLPGAPLDGGRVLAAVLWWRQGDQAAARQAAGRAGRVLGGCWSPPGWPMSC